MDSNFPHLCKYFDNVSKYEKYSIGGTLVFNSYDFDNHSFIGAIYRLSVSGIWSLIYPSLSKKVLAAVSSGEIKITKIKNISYSIRKSRRARRMRLAVYSDGRVIVTAPRGLPTFLVKNFVSSKKHWLYKKISYYESLDRKAIRVFSKADYLKYRQEALGLAHDRVRHFNQVYGFDFNKINIKNQKTRWGSCSRKKNLNLNYKILFLPETQRDYIIVHELCHLREFNHSHKFWALVQMTIPNYLEIRKALRKQEGYFR